MSICMCLFKVSSYFATEFKVYFSSAKSASILKSVTLKKFWFSKTCRYPKLQRPQAITQWAKSNVFFQWFTDSARRHKFKIKAQYRLYSKVRQLSINSIHLFKHSFLYSAAKNTYWIFTIYKILFEVQGIR